VFEDALSQVNISNRSLLTALAVQWPSEICFTYVFSGK
jgi:hypothetical protein